MSFESESIQAVLMQEFARRVRVNSRYSLRAFAKALGMSSGALSEIPRNQRPVSLKAAAKIAKAMGLTGSEAKNLFRMVETDKRNSLTEDLRSVEAFAGLAGKQIDEDTFALVAEWYHFAILNLLDCEGFRWEAAYIAKRLGLTNAQAKIAMQLLSRLGLVKMKNGQVRGADDYVLSPSGIPSAAVRTYHRQILGKAIEALELQSVEQREMNGVGFSVDPKRLPQIKREISDFLDELVSKHSKGKRQDVYFLETALFQLTQGKRDDK